MIDLRSGSVAATHAIAGVIAGLVRPRDIIVLAGDMGAGKTAFTVGFTRALGVSEEDQVSSPTFTLVHSYNSGRIPVLHADLYRLNSMSEVADLGLREQVDLGAVALVEWGDVAAEVIGDSLTIELSHDDDDDDARDIVISVEGHGWDTRWDKLRDSLREWSVR
ncbi:MAG: tRNA (adenosine(37)-N6)-threonylcarbamoyltransferase complex ATPase subunit type 1 TsaE [Actinobacteria bacterium]|uniref:tRNA threonylcarbamoyladenosine biosynthesis protein TsaE n=1 Tax=freshwater metagenome TaxID=449393 RepID=A0A6J6JR54_9ZZZZ|nr:tRNA (adenosine(37)-N6)-threonylcarbamoyltransferase complex ATPase subunit type 1 TsaE [Actinomycetota bacterium]